MKLFVIFVLLLPLYLSLDKEQKTVELKSSKALKTDKKRPILFLEV